MKNKLFISLIIILTFHLTNAQKKIFDKNGELTKIVDKNNKELGYWTFIKGYVTLADHVYVVGNKKDPNKNGNWEAYYKNGKLQEKGEYQNNKKIGFWKKYHDDGVMGESGTYKNDLRQGEWLFNYKHGYAHADTLQTKANYIDGELNGHFEQYYLNGKLEMKGDYDKGNKTGKWSFYYENGQLNEEMSFANQELHGMYKSFRENGTPFKSGEYKNGKQIGKWTDYDDKNKLRSATIYDSISKKITWYHDNGKTKRIANYKNNGKTKSIYPERYFRI